LGSYIHFGIFLIDLKNHDDIQQAYYCYEELIATYGPNAKLLTGQGIVQMFRGFYPEADALLMESLNKVF
jgi:hypothetical protein